MRFAGNRRRLTDVLVSRRVAGAVAVGVLLTVAGCTDAPAPDQPPAPPSSTATPSPASTVARSSAPTTATPSQTATSTGAPVLPPRAGRRWVRYECTYAAESLQGKVTTDAITYQTDYNGLPGPTYTELSKAFPGEALIPAEGYLVTNDVAGRHLVVVLYPLSDRATPAAIAAGRQVIANNCAAIAEQGTTPPAAPDSVGTTQQN